jgi:hypothetical protein
MDQSIRAGRWIGKLANAQVGAPIVFLYPTGRRLHASADALLATKLPELQ